MNYIRIRNWDKYQRIGGDKAPYVQVQTDILLDMDFMGMPDRERLCFLFLLCLAGRTQNKLPADPRDIQHLCHFDDVPDMSLMMSRGLIEDWCPEKHQQTIDTNDERRKYERRRKRQWRESRKSPESVPAKSQGERETETETDIDKKKDQEIDAQKRVVPQKKPTRKTQLKQTSLEDDWRDYCRTKRPDLDPDDVWEDFTDYWVGRGAVMADWKRTWQGWVRRQKPPERKKQTPMQEFYAKAERIIRECQDDDEVSAPKYLS